jgi:amino acid transporter
MKATAEVPPGRPATPPRRTVGLLPLVATTYFIVSGGPFGLEDLISDTGYARTIAILIATPLLWSLPTALAVGELAAAYPEEGGYYAWVRRALGPFWGVQEGWLSIVASFFDLAIYPTLFTRYLAQLWPPASQPTVSVAVGVGLIAACTALNLRGARSAAGASVLLAVALLSPFVALVLAAWVSPAHDPVRHAAAPAPALFAGFAVAMWNYMGWDNASTIAGEVHDPGRTYPRTMFLTVVLVALTYVIPVLAIAHTGLAPAAWTQGTWALAGEKVGGHGLGVAIAIAGMISSAGMMSALVMSYSRLPLVLADDGYLPQWLGRRSASTGAPVYALVVCGVAYSLCLGLGFRRLVEIDVVIYGASLALEFIALVVLRVKEPSTTRPFRIPGGLAGAVLVGVVPMALLGWSLTQGGDGEGGAVGVVVLAVALVLIGPALVLVRRLRGPEPQVRA